jgi:hypothetical protein
MKMQAQYKIRSKGSTLTWNEIPFIHEEIDNIDYFINQLFALLHDHPEYEVIRWNLFYNYRYNFVSEINLYPLVEENDNG